MVSINPTYIRGKPYCPSGPVRLCWGVLTPAGYLLMVERPL